VIRLWEAADAMKAARAEAVLAATASTQEAATAREGAAASIKQVEARTTLAKREARARVSKVEAESTASLASAHGEVVGFTQKVVLLEGVLVDARQVQDTSEANFQGLSDGAAGINRPQDDADRQCRDLVHELILLQTWGSELHQVIVSPPMVLGHLLEVMQFAAICHAEMAGQFAGLQAVVSPSA
jgi:hypothetical protein